MLLPNFELYETYEASHNVKVLFCPIFSHIQKNISVFEFSRRVCLSFCWEQYKYEYEYGEQVGRKWMTSEKTCPTATPSTTNLSWTDLGSSPSLRFERSATNSLSHGKALKGSGSTTQYLKIQSLTQKKHTASLLQRQIDWYSLENNRLLRWISHEGTIHRAEKMRINK
jgi:hypothetical protein